MLKIVDKNFTCNLKSAYAMQLAGQNHYLFEGIDLNKNCIVIHVDLLTGDIFNNLASRVKASYIATELLVLTTGDEFSEDYGLSIFIDVTMHELIPFIVKGQRHVNRLHDALCKMHTDRLRDVIGRNILPIASFDNKVICITDSTLEMEI